MRRCKLQQRKPATRLYVSLDAARSRVNGQAHTLCSDWHTEEKAVSYTRAVEGEMDRPGHLTDNVAL
jgi:hypothetical protein